MGSKRDHKQLLMRAISTDVLASVFETTESTHKQQTEPNPVVAGQEPAPRPLEFAKLLAVGDLIRHEVRCDRCRATHSTEPKRQSIDHSVDLSAD